MWRRKICDTCGWPIPEVRKFDPNSIPCSNSHIRCLRCGWPVAKGYIDEDEICDLCKGVKR